MPNLQRDRGVDRPQGIVLRPDTSSLYDQLLFTELHAVESSNGLIRDRVVGVLAKRVAFRQGGGAVLHQVEGPERSKRRQQLFDLVLVEIVGEAADEDLVLRVLHHRRDDAGQVHWRLVDRSRHRLVVARTSYLQGLIHEVNSVESERSRRFVDWPKFQKGKILVQIYLNGQDRVSGRLGQARNSHLVVEKLHHRVLGDAERYVADVQTTSLSRDLASGDWNLRSYNSESLLLGYRRAFPNGHKPAERRQRSWCRESATRRSSELDRRPASPCTPSARRVRSRSGGRPSSDTASSVSPACLGFSIFAFGLCSGSGACLGKKGSAEKRKTNWEPRELLSLLLFACEYMASWNWLYLKYRQCYKRSWFYRTHQSGNAKIVKSENLKQNTKSSVDDRFIEIDFGKTKLKK